MAAKPHRCTTFIGLLTMAVISLGLTRVLAEDPPKDAGHKGRVLALSYSPDGRLILSGGEDGSIRLWTAEGRLKAVWPSKHGQVLAVAIAPDGRSAASCGYGSTAIWDFPAGRRRLLFDDEFARKEGRHTKTFGACRAIAFSSDGKLVAVGDGESSGTVAVRDATTGKLLHRLVGDNDTHSLAFSPDCRWLVVGGQKRMHVWDLKTGRRSDRMKGQECEELEPMMFTPGGRHLIAGSDSVVIIWDWASGKRRLLNEVFERDIWITSIAVAPDCRTMVVGGYLAGVGEDDGMRRARQIRVVELASGRVRFMTPTTNGFPWALAFSPDGRTLAIGYEDGTIQIRPTKSLAGAPPGNRSKLNANQLWADLASSDAARAFTAMRVLQTQPMLAYSLLSRLFVPIPALEPKVFRRLLDSLDAKSFAERSNASRALAEFGERAVPVIQSALKEDLSPEVHRSLERLLAICIDQRYRAIRCVELLESIDSEKARELLHKLADGPTHLVATEEARIALRRLKGASRP